MRGCPVALEATSTRHRLVRGAGLCRSGPLCATRSGDTVDDRLAFFREETARGLTGVALVTSDAHRGLVSAYDLTCRLWYDLTCRSRHW